MAAYVRLSAERAVVDAAGDGIIKAADYAQSVAAETVLKEANADAADSIERAQAQAAEIIGAAEARAASIIADAEARFDEAHAAGKAKGLEDAKAEIAEQMMTMVERSVTYLAGAEQKVAEAVILCLRKVLGEYSNEELVLGQARTALRVVRAEPRIVLRVAPSVEEGLRGRIGEILQGNQQVTNLEIVGDSAMAETDCRLETEAGIVDAGLETQVAALERAILRTVERDKAL